VSVPKDIYLARRFRKILDRLRTKAAALQPMQAERLRTNEQKGRHSAALPICLLLFLFRRPPAPPTRGADSDYQIIPFTENDDESLPLNYLPVVTVTPAFGHLAREEYRAA
jgi:hypothetical protein